jgi:hypothetical protein
MILHELFFASLGAGGEPEGVFREARAAAVDPGGPYADGDWRGAGCLFALRLVPVGFRGRQPRRPDRRRRGWDGQRRHRRRTGFAGIAAVVWCNLRGWPPAEQRAVFQPVGIAIFIMIALWLGGTGMIEAETAALFLLGLPALALNTWAGLKSFGRLNDASFRRVVLGLLLLSGVSLLFRFD